MIFYRAKSINVMGGGSSLMPRHPIYASHDPIML